MGGDDALREPQRYNSLTKYKGGELGWEPKRFRCSNPSFRERKI
jgi:hypothetical protein